MRKITAPNTKNTNPEYWEKVLESHNLGKRRLGLDDITESDEPSDFKEFFEPDSLDNETTLAEIEDE